MLTDGEPSPGDLKPEDALYLAKKYGDGKIFGGTPDNSNSYDNYMILRGSLWTTERYDVGKPTGGQNRWHSVDRNESVGVDRLSAPVSRQDAIKYNVYQGTGK